jgi:hypothetical protein
MSTRRKSPVKINPLDTPLGVEDSPPTKPKTLKKKNAQTGHQELKTKNSTVRTLKLQAARPEPMIDMSLEELLQIRPPGVKEENDFEKAQATAERVEEAKDALGRLECEVVSALFPSSGLPESLEAVAARLGMTVKEVRDVADNALRGLRGTKSSRPRLSTVWN